MVTAPADIVRLGVPALKKNEKGIEAFVGARNADGGRRITRYEAALRLVAQHRVFEEPELVDQTTNAEGGTGINCAACHRLAVSNHSKVKAAANNPNLKQLGSALLFAVISTDETQAH